MSTALNQTRDGIIRALTGQKAKPSLTVVPKPETREDILRRQPTLADIEAHDRDEYDLDKQS